MASPVLVLGGTGGCGGAVARELLRRGHPVRALVRDVARGRPMRALGDLSVPHQWAFAPDLARAAVGLLGVAGRLQPFDVVHFAGHVVAPHRDLFERVARAAGRPGLPVRRLSFRALRLIGLVRPVVRELVELRYLFEHAVILDGARLRALLPGYADTPLDDAVRATVDSYRAHRSAP